MELDEKLTIDLLLYNSCSNPADESEEGWNEYSIELCCITFKVIARWVGNGKYEIKGYSTE